MIDLYIQAIKMIAANPDLLRELPSMPNVELKTGGGPVFWRDLANAAGWRIQENVIFGNCRVLDPNEVRKAWGGKSAMVEAFRRIVRSNAPVEEDPRPASAQDTHVDPKDRPRLLEELHALKEKGVITDVEFIKAKERLLKF